MTDNERNEMLALMQEVISPLQENMSKMQQDMSDIKETQLRSVVWERDITQKTGILLDGMKGIQEKFDRQDKMENRIDNLEDKVSALTYKVSSL